MGSRIPAEQRKMIRELYQAGTSLAVISERMGWSKMSVRRSLRIDGVILRSRGGPNRRRKAVGVVLRVARARAQS